MSMIRLFLAMAARRAEEIAKQNRWPAGAPGGKGGQYAPSKGAGGGKPTTTYSGYKSIFTSGSSFPGGDSPSWAAKEKANPMPPSGAKPHPAVDDKGQPVLIHYPTKPSGKETWADPNKTATFVPGGDVPAVLNGVAMKSWTDVPKSESEWAAVKGQMPGIDEDFPFTPTEGKSVGAGVIVREPDGRIWLTRPTNSFGGYINTFPKGTVEHGLSMQASAIKEAYEETGLQIRITGVLGDYERTTSKARFYVAERVGGTPKDMGWESQAIRLATQRDMGKLLNMGVDKGILQDLDDDGYFEKQVGSKKSGAWAKQPRWPSGTPLGGQWKSYDSEGMTLPPKVGSAANPGWAKKADALYATAKKGDLKGLMDAAITMQKAADEKAAAGIKNTQAKWGAQTAQYAADLVAYMTGAPKAEAAAAKINGIDKISSMLATGGKPGGSNPGGMYKDGDGNKWLVKGNAKYTSGQVNASTSDDRAHNEVLAAKLMIATGVGAPEMKLIDLEGKHGGEKSGPGSLGVASKWVDGGEGFDPKNQQHLAAIRADYAVHAWLGNYDVLGMGYDNTVIVGGKAFNIDPGGAILFRAQGLKKDNFGKDASEFDTMLKTTDEQKAVFGTMTKSQLAASVVKLANISDETIKKLVDTYGPGDAKGKADLAETLIARRLSILAKVGMMVTPVASIPGAAETVAKPVPTPPKVASAVKPTVDPAIGVPPPVIKDTAAGVSAKYAKLVAAANDAYVKGDLKALKAVAKKSDGTSAWAKYTQNGENMTAYHSALVAKLEGYIGSASVDVAAGKAAVTGADGKAWVADDKAVLQPAKGVGEKLTADEAQAIVDVYHPHATYGQLSSSAFIMSMDAMDGLLDNVKAFKPTTLGEQQLQAALVNAMGGTMVGAGIATGALDTSSLISGPMGYSDAVGIWQKAHPNGGLVGDEAILVHNAFKNNDVDKLQAFVPSGTGAASFKETMLTALGAGPSSLLYNTTGKVNVGLSEDEFDADLLTNTPGHIAASPKGTPKAYDALLSAAMSGNIGAIKATVVEQDFEAAKQAIMQHMLEKNGIYPTLGTPAKVIPPDYDTLYDAVQATGMSMNTQKWGKLQTQMWDAAQKGDVAALSAMEPIQSDSKQMKAALLAALVPTQPVAPAAPERQSVTNGPKLAVPPAAPAPKVPTGAAPNFAATKLPESNSNAKSHNPKVDAIAAAFAAGDEKAILAMNFGSNNYAVKQVNLANDALAALGSVHKVQKQQKANSHPALLGGTFQAVPGVAAPAAPEKPPTVRNIKDISVQNLPPKPDVMNWKGPGTPYSTKAWKNQANIDVINAIEAAALAGGMPAVEALKFPELNPDTGAPTGKMLTASEHPAKKLIGEYTNDIAHYIEDFLHPKQKLKAFNTISSATAKQVAAKFLGAKIGTTVNKQPMQQQFGFWIALGNVKDKSQLDPAMKRDLTSGEYNIGKQHYDKYGSLTKKWIAQVQATGGINRAIDEGQSTYGGIDLKATTKQIYADANLLPAGATLYRWQDMPKSMLKQLESVEPGLVFQSLGGFCTSKDPTATSGFGQHRLVIRIAEGAKAIHSHGTGKHGNEMEITTIPGQRYTLLSKKWLQDKGGRWEIELLMLPPDPGFIE